MSTAPQSQNTPQETDLLVQFEIINIPDEYREYYKTKRNNFFASIQGFHELWEYYIRLDAIWMREFADLRTARDPSRMFPLILYFNAHAKMRVAMELAFSGCMAEARSILRDSVEFVAHAHTMLNDPKLQETWFSKNDGEAALDAFKQAFEHYKTERLFKGLDELHKTWRELSETGSHANINATCDRFVQVTSENEIEFKLNYTGLDPQTWVLSLFSLLLTCFTMEQTLFSDYHIRLNLDTQLRGMCAEFEKRKEALREKLKVHYRLDPPGGVHRPPKPLIYTP